MERDDEIRAWDDAYHRVRDLVADLDLDQVALTVPATPAWTVKDLLAHMIGLDVDVVAGTTPEDHNDAWTQGHVDARSVSTVSDLLVEWADVAAPLTAWMRDHDTRPLGDVIIHEQDLRGALGVPGGRDSAGVEIIRDRMADRMGTTLGSRSLELRGDTWSHRWGDRPAVVVRASDHDLFRALTGRRSAAQLRAWTVEGDVGPLLDVFGSLPDQDLLE